MLKLKGKLQENDLSKEELLDNIEIKKTTPKDLLEVTRILSENMGLDNPLFAFHQLVDSNINLFETIKVVDKRDDKIYGLLVLANQNIDRGTPIERFMPETYEAFKFYTQLNGFLFLLDERLRGENIDRQMVKMALPFIKTFDIIWVGVEKSLKSHNYWKHLGMHKLFEIPQAIFYCEILNKNILSDIYKKIMKS